MRLIDADALNELLEHHERTLLYNVKRGNSNKSRDFIMGVEDGYYRVQSDIKWIPTVDAVEVVRCGKCRHYQGNHDVPGCAPCDFWGIGGVMWDDFCKRGERREK